MRTERCCICPKTYSKKKSGLCPGIPGTPHPKQSTCDFENVWHDTNGKAVFVDSGIGGKNYMSFRRSDSGGLHRVKTKYLPVRETFDEAQKDLNLYATTYGWKLG
jgi:hypothetical protein